MQIIVSAIYFLENFYIIFIIPVFCLYFINWVIAEKKTIKNNSFKNQKKTKNIINMYKSRIITYPSLHPCGSPPGTPCMVLAFNECICSFSSSLQTRLSHSKTVAPVLYAWFPRGPRAPFSGTKSKFSIESKNYCKTTSCQC